MTNEYFKSDESSPFTDLLKLSQHQRDTLAKVAVEMAPEPADAAERRRHERIAIDKFTKGFIELKGNQGNSSKYIIFPTTISQGGLSFLHGTFVHSNTPCTISVPMPDGEIMAIDANILWCRLLRGKAHEVGAKFTSLLSKEVIESFMSPPPPEVPAVSEAVDLAGITAQSDTVPQQAPAQILPVVVLKRLVALTSALDDASALGDTIKVIIKELFSKDAKDPQEQNSKNGP